MCLFNGNSSSHLQVSRWTRLIVIFVTIYPDSSTHQTRLIRLNRLVFIDSVFSDHTFPLNLIPINSYDSSSNNIDDTLIHHPNHDVPVWPACICSPGIFASSVDLPICTIGLTRSTPAKRSRHGRTSSQPSGPLLGGQLAQVTRQTRTTATFRKNFGYSWNHQNARRPGERVLLYFRHSAVHR